MGVYIVGVRVRFFIVCFVDFDGWVYNNIQVMFQLVSFLGFYF